MSEDETPHGRCECRAGCATCQHGGGPAAYEVTRAGKRICVCTRCDLSSMDTEKVLLVDEQTPSKSYYDWDALGFMCIAFTLAEKRTESAPPSEPTP